MNGRDGSLAGYTGAEMDCRISNKVDFGCSNLLRGQWLGTWDFEWELTCPSLSNQLVLCDTDGKALEPGAQALLYSEDSWQVAVLYFLNL